MRRHIGTSNKKDFDSSRIIELPNICQLRFISGRDILSLNTHISASIKQHLAKRFIIDLVGDFKDRVRIIKLIFKLL